MPVRTVNKERHNRSSSVMAVKFETTQRQNGYNMGIGKTILSRPETRFMRQCRWTIEFDWSPPVAFRDAIRGVRERIDAGFDIIQGGKDVIKGVESFYSTPTFGGFQDVIGGASDTIDAGKRLVNGPQQKDHGLSAHVVHVASRPHITLERTEIHFQHETYYIPGRPSFDPIELTIYDVQGQSELARWIWKVYRFGKRGKSGEMALTRHIKYNGYLTMWDGEGRAIQSWILYGCWPFDVDWGGLDYSSSDTADISVSISFDNIELKYDDTPAGKGNLATRSPGDFNTTNSQEGGLLNQISEGGADLLGALAGGLTSGGTGFGGNPLG